MNRGFSYFRTLTFAFCLLSSNPTTAMEPFPVCTHCGFTFGEYRLRGLLGCPHCYAGFGEALQADLAWLHQALAFMAEPQDSPASSVDSPSSSVPSAALEKDLKSAGKGSGKGSGTGSGKSAERLARWREELATAVRTENYEEAARLNRLIRGARPPGSEPDLGLA